MEKLRFKKTLLILLSGKAGVGKTTASILLKSYLEKRYDNINVDVFSFAKGVKEVARHLGWDGLKDERGRKLLQNIGQVGRTYNEDIWVNRTLYKYIEKSEKYPYDVVIIDDWRFPNEAIRTSKELLYSTYKIRIEAKDRELLKDSELDNDVSETSLPSGFPVTDYYDSIISNVGNMDEFGDQIRNLWDSILQTKAEIIL